MKQPNKNKKKPIIVNSKNDPRYIAYTDSLSLYNNTKTFTVDRKKPIQAYSKEDAEDLKKQYPGTKIIPRYNEKVDAYSKSTYEKLDRKSKFKEGVTYPSKDLQLESNRTEAYVNKKNPRDAFTVNRGNMIMGDIGGKMIPLRNTKISPIGTAEGDMSDGDNWNAGLIEIYKKPTQPVILEQNRPKAKGLDTNIKPAGLVELNNTITATQLTPKKQNNPNLKYDIEEDNVRMNGASGYGSDRDYKGVSEVQAVKAKENADKYNADIERRYNNPNAKKNSKAQERYKTLKNNVTITPSMENGGTIPNSMKKPNKKRVPKAAFGAAISAGVGVLSSVYSSIQANKAAKDARRLAYDTTMREGDIMQQDYLQDYNRNLQDDLPVYALGGDIPNTNTPSTKGKFDTVGGELEPISSSADVVQGNTHKENNIDGSYGVTLSDENGPVVNVEDKEVIVDNDMVFSDKLKKGNTTFADIAFATNSKIGELENSIKGTSSPAEKFSAQRTIEGLKRKNEQLFQEQELVKANTAGGDDTVEVIDNSVPEAENGMRINRPKLSNYWDKKQVDEVDDVYASIPERKDTMVADLLPMLADNVGNAIMTNTAPKPARPIQRVAPMVNTRINANPALADVNSTIQANNSIIRGNTSNSASARASMVANNLKGASARGNVLAQKEAQERSLENAQRAAVAANYNENAEQTDEYNEAVLDRSLQINSANSKNINNAMSNLTAVKQKELELRKDDDIFMLDLMDDQTGDKKRVFDRLGRPLYKGARDANTRENKRLGRKRI